MVDDGAVMLEDPKNRDRILESFHNALQQWVCRKNEQPLMRWLAHELDSRGSLARLAIPDWHLCLGALREARRSTGRLPAEWDDSLARLIIAALRFSRPDGSPAGEFDTNGAYDPPEKTLRDWLTATEGTETAKYLRAWQSSRKRDLNFSPEAPAWEVARGVLSVLRDEASGNGDYVAVDHRLSGPSCRFELFGSGRSWLGPSWAIDGEAGASTRAKPGSRISAAGAEIAEWSYRLGTARVTQTIVLLAGRRIALLLALFESRAPLTRGESVRLALPPSIVATPIRECRGFRLTGPKRSDSAQVLPIALPSLAYDTDRGTFHTKGDSLALTQAPAGRRCWLPLLVSWDSARNRKTTTWRVLTVTERSKPVPPGRAFAARVSWGRHESYVIYRSLGPPASRAFLGYRTHARFLIGLFTPDGNVTPIVKID
jgi:hypothetical protein